MTLPWMNDSAALLNRYDGRAATSAAAFCEATAAGLTGGSDWMGAAAAVDEVTVTVATIATSATLMASRRLDGVMTLPSPSRASDVVTRRYVYLKGITVGNGSPTSSVPRVTIWRSCTGPPGRAALWEGANLPLTTAEEAADGTGGEDLHTRRAVGRAGPGLRDHARVRRLLPLGRVPVAGALPAQMGLGADLPGVGSVRRHRLPDHRSAAQVSATVGGTTRAVVETSGLTKRYGAHTALDGVDLAVQAGSVYGLVGPNGAGKTTLLGLLSGLRRATTGRLQLATPRRKVALLPDTPQFDPWLTGREVVGLARHLVTPDGPVNRVAEVLA